MRVFSRFFNYEGFVQSQNKIDIILREIRYFFQRIYTGFDDSEVYCLDETLSEIIYLRLKRWKKITKNKIEPPFSNDLGRNFTDKEWNDVVNKMLKSFHCISKNHHKAMVVNDNLENYAKRWVEIEEGIDLFREYFHYFNW